MKKIFFLIVSLVPLVFFYSVSNNSFTVTNYTGEPISVMNFQHEKLESDPTISEMESYADRYTMKNYETREFKVLTRNRFQRRLYVGIDFVYELKSPSTEEYYSLKGTTFSSNPLGNSQQSYCSFKIDVYSDDNTIVTPLTKRFCLNSFYYYPNGYNQSIEQ